MYTLSFGGAVEVQGELFGKPKRPRRAWTALDWLRARAERADRKVDETGGSEKDLEAAANAEARLIRVEEEARAKWKNSFGS